MSPYVPTVLIFMPFNWLIYFLIITLIFLNGSLDRAKIVAGSCTDIPIMVHYCRKDRLFIPLALLFVPFWIFLWR